MPVLTKRFLKLQSVLNRRMADLTVLLEHVEKPHNLSAILRSCDAVGVLEANAINNHGKTSTFNSTAQGSQKWVKVHDHKDIYTATKHLKNQGFTLFGTSIEKGSLDYRKCDFKVPTAFVLGAEKWGLDNKTIKMMDEIIYIPMRGMVQSLNVSVAAATLLFEALRQRQEAGIAPQHGEGLSKSLYTKMIFEWAYPEVARWCNEVGRDYPSLDSQGVITENLPRTIKMRY
ncbi:TrmH family RNA methyltransferase [Prochlorococcus sp. MIT 1223]|uniref:TrmH family RNA methyltransferase n=1 Tax=Prochlorococcus sp. MIT 1223 TaxID=3096217 RepID=UPI002A7614E8|nr:TrmH family RNA methyltransferase [Prochlorococcus sp. MIT 1223]